MSLYIVDGRYSSRVYLFTGSLNTHAPEFLHIVVERTRRIVGQERIADAIIGKLLQETFRPRK